MARKYTQSRDNRYPHHHVRWYGPDRVVESKRKKRTTSMLMALPPLVITCIVVLGFGIYRLQAESPEKPGKTLQTAVSPPKLNTVPPPAPEPVVDLPNFPTEPTTQETKPEPKPAEVPEPKPEPAVIDIPLPKFEPPEPPEPPEPAEKEPTLPKEPEIPQIPDLPAPPPPIVEAPEPPVPPQPKLVEIPPPELKRIEVVEPDIKVEEASYESPVVFTTHDELRGDSPMKRTWNILLTVALASASSPALAQTPSDAATKSDVEKILKRLDQLDADTKKTVQNLTKEAAKTATAVSKINTDLTKINKEISGINKEVGKINKEVGKIKDDFAVLKGNDLQRKLDIDGVKTQMGKIEKKMAKMEKDLKMLRDLIPDSPFPANDITEIKSRLSKIEQTLTELESKPRTAFSKTNGTGRVLVINQYPEELLFIVGNQKFRVAAGASQIVESVPVGSISYEVVSPTMGSVEQRNSTIREKGTLQITVR